VKTNLFWSSLLLLLVFSLFSTHLNIVRITTAQETHDIAVVSVTPSNTSVRLGELANVTVVVENQGTTAENFTVTLYYDTTMIEMKSVTNLAATLNTTLVFSWNTADRREEIYSITEKEKSYTVKALASTLLGETDTQDNTLTSPSPIRVLCQYIAVIPQSTVNPAITPDMNYTVSIYTDYNGTDIWSWQFSLSYNPNILEGIEVRNGDLITKAKDSSASFSAQGFNNTEGTLGLTLAFFFYKKPEIPFTTTGPGTLAYVTFKVVGVGESNITLGTDTLLTRPLPSPPYAPEIYHIVDNFNFLPSSGHVLNGYFRNTEIQIIHDMAVTSVTPSSTSVLAGELVNVTVVVENQGTAAETFDAEAYYDYDPSFPERNMIGKRTFLSLTAGANITLKFTWNTTNRPARDYTITAIVPELSGETDKADNILQSAEKVTVRANVATPLPIIEIMIGVVVVVVVVVMIIVIRKRRKKPLQPE